MPLPVCEKCGRRYRIWQSTEERLLQAIFGKPLLCKKCAEEAKWPKCTKCGALTSAGLEFNDKPYCPSCMPYADQ